METLIISDDTETAAALARALAVFGHEQKRKPMTAAYDLQMPTGLAPEVAVVLLVKDELLLEQIIWGKIRRKRENPVVVLGFPKMEDFGKEQPAFNGVEDEPAAYSHAYRTIPFLLGELNGLLLKLEPVTDLAYINNCYANEKKYLRFRRLHYSPGTKLSRSEILGRLNEVYDYLIQKGRTENAEELKAGINSLPATKWKEKAFGLRRMCEDFLDEKNPDSRA